ncbi:MAG: GDYXXLXY domain-containing protein [archaeon]|nr:GDYXXLXY domain-containing protein [archaeon]
METKINSKSERRSSNRIEYIRLFAAIAVVVVIALGFILYLAWPLLTGETIILETRPVDPFDIFRGQYMEIAYSISSVQVPIGVDSGETIYVLLEKDDSVWNFKSVSLVKPSSGDFIKGEVKRVYEQTAQVEYGVEQYFFERNAKVPRFNQVKLKVSSSGQARIVEPLIDGKSIEIQYDDLSLAS